MGRTSKYKKIKAFDPFSKQNNGKQLAFIWGLGDNGAKPKKRSRTAEKLHQQKLQRRTKRLKGEAKKPLVADRTMNRPPSDDEDEFELNNLHKLTTQKDEAQALLLDDSTDNNQETQVQTVTTTTKMDPTKSMREAEKLLKLDAKSGGGAAASQYEGRRQHESKNAFNQRVKAETRQIIKQQTLTERNPEKKRRKKEFLNAKKKKKKGKTSHSHRDEDDSDDDGYRRPPSIPFGDQVERPPVFQSLPRGSKKKGNNSDNGSNNKTKKSIQTQSDIKAEQANLEKMRRQVQEQYAAIKAKRKRGGDFHL